jgi:hypothetical protein
MTERIFEIKKSPGFFLWLLKSALALNLALFDILKEFPCVETTNKKTAKCKCKGQLFYIACSLVPIFQYQSVGGGGGAVGGAARQTFYFKHPQ